MGEKSRLVPPSTSRPASAYISRASLCTPPLFFFFYRLIGFTRCFPIILRHLHARLKVAAGIILALGSVTVQRWEFVTRLSRTSPPASGMERSTVSTPPSRVL